MSGQQQLTMAGGIACLVAGTGKPMVFLRPLAPGVGNPRRIALQVEGAQLSALRARHRVFALGHPDGLRPGMSMAEIADRYAVALAAQFAEPVDIVGFSTSGGLALELAIRHPELVDRLVVVASACRLGERGRQAQRHYAQALARGDMADANLAMVPGFSQSAQVARVVAAGSRLAPKPTDLPGLLALLSAEDELDVESQLGRIVAPTMLVSGTRDFFYPPELARLTASGIPAATHLSYAGKQHHQVLGGRRFARDVETFLSAHPARARMAQAV